MLSRNKIPVDLKPVIYLSRFNHYRVSSRHNRSLIFGMHASLRPRNPMEGEKTLEAIVLTIIVVPLAVLKYNRMLRFDI